MAAVGQLAFVLPSTSPSTAHRPSASPFIADVSLRRSALALWAVESDRNVVMQVFLRLARERATRSRARRRAGALLSRPGFR
jgi:hypothetical protein